MRRVVRRPSGTLAAAALLLASCSPDSHSVLPASPAVPGESMLLADFDSQTLPKNNAGDESFSQYGGEGGVGRLLQKPGAGVAGGSLVVTVTSGELYLQFNSHNANGTRGFVREYCAKPSAWKFNTYNRLSFWMKNPPNGSPLDTTGRASIQFGTYVKRVRDADPRSDEAGGDHWYHHLNIPNTGTWTRVIINPHPHHVRQGNGNQEQGVQEHPTGEQEYNYFDALTRFYVNETDLDSPAYPLEYQFDDFRFYQEARPENDRQVYSLAATYVPSENRYILTWSRPKDENEVKHEVRWARRDIHAIGWDAAEPAPDGIVSPAGWQGYNGMFYSTRAIPAGGPVWFAVRPQGASAFSQISLP